MPGCEKVFEIYIKTTPERLWQAIIDPDERAKYNFGAAAFTDWKPGSRYEMSARDGTVRLGEGANGELYGGWPMILSGLETWLETGETLTTPGSLRYT